MRNNDYNERTTHSFHADDMYPRKRKRSSSLSDDSLRLPNRDSVCVPDTLITAVPSCAVSCVEEFVQSQYTESSCSERESLDFLCTTINDSGLTIGEGGLQCVFSNCNGQELENVGVYSICAGVANAVPETATIITATLGGGATMSSASLPSSIPAPSAIQTATAIATDSGSLSVPPAITQSASSLFGAPATGASRVGLSTASTVTSVPAATSGASTTTTTSHNLSEGQITGIAAAGGGLIVFVVALFAILLCLRRRRRRRRRRSELLPMTPSPHLPPGGFPFAEKAIDAPPTVFQGSNQRFYAPQQPEQRRRSLWRKDVNPADIGVAISPDLPQDPSPGRSESQTSMSRLLPPLHEKALPPAPLRISRSDLQPAAQPITTPIVPATHQTQVTNFASFHSPQPPKKEISSRRQPPPPIIITTAPESKDENLRASRLPLTPTYDNGNIQQHQRPVGNNPVLRASSVYDENRSSQYTDIEAEITPPENDFTKTLATRPTDSFTSMYPLERILPDYMRNSGLPQLQSQLQPRTVRWQDPESPIRGLQYPSIPRPAAVSKHAEQVARPRAGQQISTDLRAPPPPPFLAAQPNRFPSDDSYIYTDSNSNSSQRGLPQPDRTYYGAPPQQRHMAPRGPYSRPPPAPYDVAYSRFNRKPPPPGQHARRTQQQRQVLPYPVHTGQLPYYRSDLPPPNMRNGLPPVLRAGVPAPDFRARPPPSLRPGAPVDPFRGGEPLYVPGEVLRLTPGETRGGDVYFTVEG